MKQHHHARARRVGSAMGRIAPYGPHVSAASVFQAAGDLSISRRLVRNTEGAAAFADAFVTAWFRAQGRRAEAVHVRRLVGQVSTDVLALVEAMRAAG